MSFNYWITFIAFICSKPTETHLSCSVSPKTEERHLLPSVGEARPPTSERIQSSVMERLDNFLFSSVCLRVLDIIPPRPGRFETSPATSHQPLQKWLRQPRLGLPPLSAPSSPPAAPRPSTSSSSPAFSSCHVPGQRRRVHQSKTAQRAETPVRKVGRPNLGGRS